MDKIFEIGNRIKAFLNMETALMENEIGQLKEFTGQVTELIEKNVPSEKSRRPVIYKTGTLFLNECFEYLTESRDEVIHLVSGVKLNENHYTLDRMEKIQFEANVAGARADIKGLFVKLNEIDEKFGHPLLAVFHSHPFTGKTGTFPSIIDRNLQTALENSGYRAIQAIFSRDGFIRFFSNEIVFKIEIFGKGMQKLEGKNNEWIFRFNDGGVQNVFNEGIGDGSFPEASADSGVLSTEPELSRWHFNWRWWPWRRNRGGSGSEGNGKDQNS